MVAKTIYYYDVIYQIVGINLGTHYSRKKLYCIYEQ